MCSIFPTILGNRDKCLDILKKAKNLKAEPVQMIATAIERFNMALTSLQIDEKGDIRHKENLGHVNISGSKPPLGPATR